MLGYFDGRNPKGHQKQTWKQDLELMGVEEEEKEDVLDRDHWKLRLNCMRYRLT